MPISPMGHDRCAVCYRSLQLGQCDIACRLCSEAVLPPVGRAERGHSTEGLALAGPQSRQPDRSRARVAGLSPFRQSRPTQ
jgi:hypothetical protein